MVRRITRELGYYLRDNTHAWILQPDGSYVRQQPSAGEKLRHAQQRLQNKLALPLVDA